MDARRRGSGAPGGRWPEDTEELAMEDVEIVEDGVEVVDEITPVRRPVPGVALAQVHGDPERKSSLEQDFDQALADALGADTARDVAELKRKRKRERKLERERALGKESRNGLDYGAMDRRPVEVSGEVRLFDAGDLAPEGALPEDSEGGVHVSEAMGPGEQTEGTARIRRPADGGAPAAGRRARVGIVVAALGLLAAGLLVVGVMFLRQRAQTRRSKQIERKLKLLKLKRKLQKRHAIRLPPGQCPSNMVWVATGKTLPPPGFCVDVYEFPNKKGARPEVVEDPKKAEALCWEQGKRVCSKAEWQRACRGKQGLKFPYGSVYNPSRCVSKPPKAEAPPVQASGSWSGCRSDEGVHDLSGNLAEWVKEGVLVGGSGVLTGDDTACDAEGRGGSPAYYGTRCCLSPLAK